MKKLLAVLALLLAIQGVSYANTQSDPAEYIRQIQAEDVSYSSYGFFKSIKGGNTAIVEKFLKAGMNPNSTYMTITAIDWAIKYNQPQIVKALLDSGARVNPLARNTTPLLTAIKYKNPQMIDILVAHGANVNQIVDKVTPMNYAIKRGNPDVVRKLINAGATTNEEILLNGLKSKNENIKNMVLIHYKSSY